jgi:hypothetical protein
LWQIGPIPFFTLDENSSDDDLRLVSAPEISAESSPSGEQLPKMYRERRETRPHSKDRVEIEALYESMAKPRNVCHLNGPEEAGLVV